MPATTGEMVQLCAQAQCVPMRLQVRNGVACAPGVGPDIVIGLQYTQVPAGQALEKRLVVGFFQLGAHLGLAAAKAQPVAKPRLQPIQRFRPRIPDLQRSGPGAATVVAHRHRNLRLHSAGQQRGFTAP